MAGAAPPTVYWVDAPDIGRLAVVGRPDGGHDLLGQLQALREAGIDTLVSLLVPREAANIGLADEAGAAQAAGITFHTMPTGDFGVPASFADVSEVIDRVAADLRAGRGVGAHCFAGRGRSPMFVAAVLVHHGYTPDNAISAVSTARGRRIPETDAQRRWIAEYADWRRATRSS
jgi:hypothetical protein